MKAEEYINKNKLQNQYGGYDISDDYAFEAIEMARKEEREKPTWHDLRKNPDDLPDNDRIVLIISDYHVTTSNYSNLRWGYEETYNMNVLAWIDIPEFK